MKSKMAIIMNIFTWYQLQGRKKTCDTNTQWDAWPFQLRTEQTVQLCLNTERFTVQWTNLLFTVQSKNDTACSPEKEILGSIFRKVLQNLLCVNHYFSKVTSESWVHNNINFKIFWRPDKSKLWERKLGCAAETALQLCCSWKGKKLCFMDDICIFMF